MCYDQISSRGPSGLSFMYGQDYRNHPYSSPQGYNNNNDVGESKESLDSRNFSPFDFLNLAMVRQRLEENRWRMEQMEIGTSDNIPHPYGNALSFPTNPFRNHLKFSGTLKKYPISFLQMPMDQKSLTLF